MTHFRVVVIGISVKCKGTELEYSSQALVMSMILQFWKREGFWQENYSGESSNSEAKIRKAFRRIVCRKPTTEVAILKNICTMRKTKAALKETDAIDLTLRGRISIPKA